MQIKLKEVFKYILLFLIGAFIVYLLFKNQNFSVLINDIKAANWWWATWSAVAVVFSHWFRALRWQILIEPINQKNPNLLHTFNALMIGYVTNLLVPRAGEITRCAVLSKRENISITYLIGTVITERIIDLLVLLILVIGTFLIYSQLIFDFISSLNLTPQNFTSKLIWIVVLIAICVITIFVLRFFKNKNSLIQKLYQLLNQFKAGFLSIKKIKQPFMFFAYTFIIWVSYIVSSYLCFRALSETTGLDFQAALLTVVAGSFGMIAPIQGGIGAFHFMVTEALALLNISKKIGLEYATIIHAAQTVAIIIFGLIALFLEFIIKKSIHVSKQSENPRENF